MFEYMFARNRKAYVQIAFSHWTTPKHVWELAHGHRAKSEKDKEIIHELLDLGIIHRRGHHDEDEEEVDNDEVGNEEQNE